MFNQGIISFARTFPPPANCVAHYDASHNASVHIGTGVSQWDDLSGNGHHLLQATGSLQPVYSGSGQTSLVTFDGPSGNGQYMKAGTFTLNQPETVYFVGKQITWISNAKMFDGGSALSVDFNQTGSSPSVGVYAGSGGFGVGILALNTLSVVAIVYNGTSSSITINNGSVNVGNAGTNNAGGFTLGAVQDGTQPANVGVQEIYLYNTGHTVIQQTEIVTFLRTKWGI
jgi:hypothetical protein